MQPTGTSARTEPAIEFSSIEKIGVQLKMPTSIFGGRFFDIFGDGAGPDATEGADMGESGAASGVGGLKMNIV